MNKKISIIIIFIILMIPLYIKAATFTLKLNCPSNSTAGSTVSCTLSLTQSGGVSAIKGNFNLGSLTYKGFDKSESYDISTVDQDGFLLGKTDGFSNSITLGKLKVMIPSNAKGGDEFTVTIKNVGATDLEYNDIIGPNISDTIRIYSDVNTLSSLTVSGTTFAFYENVTSYSITVNSSSTTISAIAKDSKASVSGTGTKSLNYGKNEFKVVVTAENGTKKTYTLNITRPDNRSSNNSLKSLSVDVGTIIFNKETLTYNLEVGNDVTTVKISASVEDEKANFIKDYGPRTVTLKNGKNAILIKVVAENESINTYTININKKDNRSNDNYLSNIEITPGSINFDKKTLSYTVEVDSDVTNVSIIASASDSNAKIKNLFPSSLVEGKNEYKIIVTAENGDTKTYIINVIKKSSDTTPTEQQNSNESEQEAIPSDIEQIDINNAIKNIIVDGYVLNFDSNKLEYILNIKDNKLNISVDLNDANSNYEIIGNDDLKPGSIIKIIVRNQNGDEKTYQIKIIENEKSNFKIIILIFINIINALLLILLIKKKLNNKKTN